MARESIHFPPGKSANLLRGAFGVIFRRIACVPHCPGARECEGRGTCPYARMFEPSALDGGLSGLAGLAASFRFSSDSPGWLAAFSFDLNLFDMPSPAIAYLVLAFSQLARDGLGPNRGRAGLSEVWQVGEDGEPVERVRVRFTTPTELKSGQGYATG